MFSKKALPLLTMIVLVILSVGAACSHARTEEDILTEVKSRIASDPSLESSHLTITADHGIVTLSGEVADDTARLTAFKLASQTRGVTIVRDLMTTVPIQQQPLMHGTGQPAVDNASGRDLSGVMTRDFSVEPPPGQVQMNPRPNISEKTLDVPVYPGAKVKDGNGSIAFSGGGVGSGSMEGVTLVTHDSVEKVVEFYKGKLGNDLTVFNTTAQGKHVVVLNRTKANSWITITVEDEGNGDTKISIASVNGSVPQ